MSIIAGIITMLAILAILVWIAWIVIHFVDKYW